MTRRLVNKLLHEPTVRLKDAAGSARGELYADALAALFALDEPASSVGTASGASSDADRPGRSAPAGPTSQGGGDTGTA